MLPSILPSFFFIFYAVVAFLGAYLAFRKGRSPIGWFFGTLFLGLLGIFLLLVLPPKNSVEGTHKSNSEEDSNTDFLETLDSSDPENVNNDLFLSPDAHSILDETDPKVVLPEEEKWFFLDPDKQAIGPLPREELLKKIKETSNETKPWEQVWVWKKGMKDWERAGNVECMKN